MSYKYKNPLKEGYRKVPKNKYKEIINQYNWKAKYEVYENDNCYLINQFEPFWIVLVNIILLPLLIILYGVFETKEIFADIYGLMFQKKTGSFLSMTVYKDELKKKDIEETLSKIK